MSVKEVVMVQDYPFLSIDYPSTVKYGNSIFNDARAAIVSLRCANDWDAKSIIGMQGIEAEKVLSKRPVRADWEDVKQFAVQDVILHKFLYNPILRAKLLEIGDVEFFDGTKSNLLGKAVSYARNYIKDAENTKQVVGSKILSYSNGENGIQPNIVIECDDGKRYMITISNSNKFLIGEVIDTYDE